MKYLSHPLTIAGLLGASALLILGAGCSQLTPKGAGVVAAAVIKKTAPKAVPYVSTITAAVRSVAGETAPTPTTVSTSVSSWVSLLPIPAKDKQAAIQAVSNKYADAYPDIEKAENAYDELEAFAAGLEQNGL